MTGPDPELLAGPETGPGNPALGPIRRATAEAVGTGLLVLAVIGSGIAAERLSPTDTGIQLLENSFATAGALAALILVFGTVSGAHFNPVVTLTDRLFGTISSRDAALYVGAQIFGGCTGAILANLTFELPAIDPATKVRASAGLWIAEIIATAGLLLVIHGCVRSGRRDAVPLAVAAWIAGAYWFAASTSFANPAVTIARTLSDSFAGIAPSSAPMFIVMQVIGAGVGVILIRSFFPAPEEAP